MVNNAEFYPTYPTASLILHDSAANDRYEIPIDVCVIAMFATRARGTDWFLLSQRVSSDGCDCEMLEIADIADRMIDLGQDSNAGVAAFACSAARVGSSTKKGLAVVDRDRRLQHRYRCKHGSHLMRWRSPRNCVVSIELAAY